MSADVVGVTAGAAERSRRNPLDVLGLAESPALYGILLAHGYRGVRIQLLLRAALVVFVVLVVVFVPPKRDSGSCYVIVGCYAAWAAAVTLYSRRGGDGPVRFIWLALFVDVVMLAALTLVAGASAEQSWTAHLLINGFFLIPMLAATQLRPWICTAVSVPTVAVYFYSSVATRHANTEPWSSVLIRTGVLAALAVGCVLLSYVQRSRVVTIGRLVADRTTLLTETLTIQDRERRERAEQLHDGALQYVLAARMDLDDARDTGDGNSFDRVEEALRESSQLLRSTMTELHPAVLEQSGLLAALRDLIRTTSARGNLVVDVTAPDWPEHRRTTSDALLFASARELLGNVVKHAQATEVRLDLSLAGGVATLRISDDGCGIPDGMLEQRLSEGHIGLASRRVRLEVAGGPLTLQSAVPHGTVATVTVPAEELDDERRR